MKDQLLPEPTRSVQLAKSPVSHSKPAETDTIGGLAESISTALSLDSNRTHSPVTSSNAAPTKSTLPQTEHDNSGGGGSAFRQVVEKDGPGIVKFQSITCLSEYANSSFEELRLHDYSQGYKFKNSKIKAELSRYINTLHQHAKISPKSSAWLEEVKTTPLFNWPVMELARSGTLTKGPFTAGEVIAFDQYALLGHEIPSAGRSTIAPNTPVFMNTNAPSSAFICGSQGSGKSYTLSCMLENCLIQSKTLGPVKTPLSAMVFAYDSNSTDSVSEAAYLATHVSVNVLVSPSNYHRMKKLYGSIQGLGSKITVVPLLLKEAHLNTQRMLRLMAFSDKDGAVPLYMEVSL